MAGLSHGADPLTAPKTGGTMGAVWFAYVLVAHRARRTYVGVTTDVARRLRQHNGELRGGARTTRAGRPWKIGVVHGPFDSRGAAQVLEHKLRRLRGDRRLR